MFSWNPNNVLVESVLHKHMPSIGFCNPSAIFYDFDVASKCINIKIPKKRHLEESYNKWATCSNAILYSTYKISVTKHYIQEQHFQLPNSSPPSQWFSVVVQLRNM